MENSVKHDEHGMPKVMASSTDVFTVVVTPQRGVEFGFLDKSLTGVVHITPGFFNRVFLFHLLVFFYYAAKIERKFYILIIFLKNFY